MKKATLTLSVAFALLSSKAFAHFPTLECSLVDSQLTCLAGYSDGSSAHDEVVEVRDYSDNVLSRQTTNADGEITIAMPDGEFYLIFDPGHEQPAEFDYAEL